MRLGVLLLVGLAAFPASATRDGVAYDISVAGVPIGDAWLRADLDGARYALQGGADFGFLFWGGEGVARSDGAVEAGTLRPAEYRLAYQGVSRPGRVEITFEGDTAVRWERQPPIPPEDAEGRVEISAEHLRGVLDPLTALVIAAPADAAPETICARVLPVFSGYTRFDLSLRAATIDADGAVACDVRYAPVAGHRPDSPGVDRMRRPGAIAISLSPIAPGLWGPKRLAVATRFGTAELARRG
jgi:hypothetical protein